MGDAEEKLRQLEAEARAEERKVLEAEAEAARATQRKEAAEATKRREGDRRAPGYFSQMRFVGLMAVALVAGALLGGAWSEGAPVGPVFLYGAPVWALAVLVTWVDSLTWKKRLPFEVRGEDVISGTDGTGSDRVPWIGVTIRVVLQANATHPAVNTTLQVFASQMNTMMKADTDASFTDQQRWLVKHGLLRGETTKAMYTTRMLEKWLRREVRLLHEVARIERVEVSAAYTGSSYWAPSSD